ncbi:MAG: HEAT repeat domain-containing protein [Planctomycetota bacterium]|jgi:HEAT repeat protein
MWKKKYICIQCLFVLFVLLGSNGIGLSGEGKSVPVSVVHCPNQAASLQQRWQWALEQISSQPATRNIWIGYSNERLMSANSFIGRWPVDPDYPTLGELIYGVRVELPERSYSSSRTSLKVVKEVACLFEFDRTSKSVGQIQVSNISLTIYMKQGVLFWLGKVGYEQSLSLLQKLYNDTDDDYLKRRLIGHIGDMRHPLVIPFLNNVLQNEQSERVRKEAVDELENYQSMESLEILLWTAQHDSSNAVSRRAVESISRIELPAAENALIELAKTGPSPTVRRVAIDELRDISSLEAMNCLASIVDQDGLMEIRRDALESLARIENEKAMDMLIRIAREHADPRIRYEAIGELRRYSSPKIIVCLESVINKKDEIYQVRREALETLRRIENDSVFDSLIRIAGTNVDPRIRDRAIYKMRDIDELRHTTLPKVIKCLENIINNQTELEKIQRTAVDCLADYGTKEALDLLMQIAQTHVDPRIRRRAIDKLGDRPPSEVIDCLYLIINKQQEPYKIQREALEALTRFEDDKALEMLIGIVKAHAVPRVRKEAINRLGDVDELRLDALTKAVDCLAGVVNRKDELEENQRKALDALAHIENNQTLDVLIMIVGSHSNPRIREKAIDRLRGFDELTLDAYPKIIKCLKDVIDNQKELEDIQRRALDALKDIEQQDVWAYIEMTAVTHPKSRIRREAQEIVAYRIRER